MIELNITHQCLLLANNLTFESKEGLTVATFGDIKIVFKRKNNWVMISEMQLTKGESIELNPDTKYETEKWVRNYGCLIAAIMYALKVSYVVCGKSAFSLNYSSALIENASCV